MPLTKFQLKLARRIWGVQKKHPKVKFMPKHFTKLGKLTKLGMLKIKKKRR